MDANVKEVKERMMARLEAMKQNNQERMEAWIDADNEKFDVLQSILISWMDIHEARQRPFKKK
jgi:hypothetical protein